jgi:hypothetical protein
VLVVDVDDWLPSVENNHEVVTALVRVARRARAQGCSFGVARAPQLLRVTLTRAGVRCYDSVTAANDALIFDATWRT